MSNGYIKVKSGLDGAGVLGMLHLGSVVEQESLLLKGVVWCRACFTFRGIRYSCSP